MKKVLSLSNKSEQEISFFFQNWLHRQQNRITEKKWEIRQVRHRAYDLQDPQFNVHHNARKLDTQHIEPKQINITINDIPQMFFSSNLTWHWDSQTLSTQKKWRRT